MKVSTEIDNNFGYEKITQLVDNIPLTDLVKVFKLNRGEIKLVFIDLHLSKSRTNFI
jgi:hypothetical protein